ncbi:ribonuclease III [Candidatus Giovannonibacteria bacterium RIFCSPHIGHO2_01_FULL_45_33]|uniref:Ribonuclease 3 n=1 Tax=Candidatus Giovannonibacteria bacterium RIFCSPLOWO2_01_FULL_45_34 TaxID=1798351 RepID=A0A1F5X0D3_9BACT|nr:MAG: ribonuclease III [Candidatus Giovannonibacteria bacterium RIFCSPHIGHO2_01_FULL_45_33]OGF70201.1 MAG: ribonuclease III [Candidatus Giovannonibacteria bacterium RIFCSPHIGHO2_02_FULL_44_11]OGF81356.1 MAG: ribonuclease III [Candidatus Giovannonibacteria bacterium RIFCSPLOWO2_01_FULL_45_34]
MIDFTEFEKNIGVEFGDKELLKTALTHRSYLNENAPASGEKSEHNERLEFLGDAVLELVITEHLYKLFPDKPEGDLTSFRASLVNANMLGEVARDLNYNKFLLLSRGEAKDVGRARQYILANAFESVVGAVYLDRGYDVVKDFILRVLDPKIGEIVEKKLYRDAKSLFQEEAQERESVTPTYKVVKEWGPDHDRHFIVGVYLGKELIAEGEGPSKQAAQQQAAEVALQTKGWG